MDTVIDTRGGRSDGGTAGVTFQKRWEKEYDVTDAWRRKNPDTIGVTRTNRFKDQNKGVQI